jgi:hypothetical protein
MDPKGSQTLELSPLGNREEEKRCAWKLPLLNSTPVCSGHSACAARGWPIPSPLHFCEEPEASRPDSDSRDVEGIG